MRIDRIIRQVRQDNPYNGKAQEAYIKACDKIRSAVNARLYVEFSPSIITLKMSDIQLYPRKWYQLYKRGWHKHIDIWGRKWWIRYKWNQ